MLHIKAFAFNPLQENTYVIYQEKDACAIIDPGCYFQSERNQLVEFIRQQGLSPKYLLNTHCHLDHVFGNQFIHQHYGLELFLHPSEAMVLDYAPEAGRRWNMPFENYDGPRHWLNEGDRIALGPGELEVLHTPGHSPGSISFYCADQKFVVSGDVLFLNSIGRTDLPGGDFDTLIGSIREKLFRLPEDTCVYSGHGASTTIGREERENPFLLAS